MYECNTKDRIELELIQEKILERIRELNELDLPLREDAILENYYALNAQIQNCILHDYSFSPITVGVILGAGVAVALSFYFRIWRKRKQIRRY
tara:strand:+ start:4766 stop:5044 length:279 start_codon:yes stop_codon:yes gene_type:complete